MLFWILTGYIWMDHQLYQHLICRAKGHSEIFCAKKLMVEAEKFTPNGTIANVKAVYLNGIWKGSLNWNIQRISIPIKQTLKLP